MLIGQVTDIHLGFEPDNPNEFNRKRLDQVLDRLAGLSTPLDMLLATGDLVDRGDSESYRQLRSAFDACDFPVWPCLGNHDNRATFRSWYPEIPTSDGFVQYEVETDSLRILVLDTLEEGRHGGSFCNVRANWLTSKLAEKPDQATLIVMHHPPVEAGLEWMNTHHDEPWVERFSAAVAGHRQVTNIVCGHVHRPISVGWRGTNIAICPSTAPQVALDLAPLNVDEPDGRSMIIADPPAFALHWWNQRELISHFDTAEDHIVLARFDFKMQGLVKSLMGERPGGVPYYFPH
jgi:3',5'-cyclic-AMP phosphodiesterase